jgi:hypothetical protein
MGENKRHKTFYSVNMKGKYDSRDLGVDGREILKWIERNKISLSADSG